MEPPIQTEYLRSGGAVILTYIKKKDTSPVSDLTGKSEKQQQRTYEKKNKPSRSKAPER